MPRPRRLNAVHPYLPRSKAGVPEHVQEFIDSADPAIDCVTELLHLAREMDDDPTDRDVFLWAVAEGRLAYRRQLAARALTDLEEPA